MTSTLERLNFLCPNQVKSPHTSNNFHFHFQVSGIQCKVGRGSGGRFSFSEVNLWGVQPPATLLSFPSSVGFIRKSHRVGGHTVENEVVLHLIQTVVDGEQGAWWAVPKQTWSTRGTRCNCPGEGWATSQYLRQGKLGGKIPAGTRKEGKSCQNVARMLLRKIV